MRTLVALSLLGLGGWSLLAPRAEAQPAPRRSLVGGSWHGTIVQAGIPVKVMLEFHRDGTYSGTHTMPAWGPFERPFVSQVGGKWWLEAPGTVALLGSGGFRASLRWIDNNTIETFDMLWGHRVRWQRRP